jgi:wyosine [tRNA(Phe)-imidazoG37] synthetase (radical SAM superfamily)
MGFRRKTAEQKEAPKQSSNSKVADKGSKGKSDFVKFATLMRTKDGERTFVSFNDPTDDKYAKFEEILVDGRKVKAISTSSVEEVLERLVKAGHLTEDQAQERLNKTPETIIGEVTFILE